MAANTAASVKARLLARARQMHEDFQLLLTRYGLERFLYRLGRTSFAQDFVLKGAMLFAAWSGAPHRSTRDIDFLGFGEASAHRLVEAFRTVCSIPCPADGLAFDADSVEAEEIREAQEYGGFRVHLLGRLEAATVPVQLDVGFGDAVTPSALELEYPTILPLPAPRVRAYPPETVIAEKTQALVALGIANSRMKDFYDLLFMSQQFSFTGAVLVEALQATFDRRRTEFPAADPVALTDEFALDPAKRQQWRSFLARIGVLGSTVELPEAMERLREFLLPLVAAARGTGPAPATWPPGGPWASMGR